MLESNLPVGDALVIAGDMTARGEIVEITKVGEWLNWQLDRYEHVIVVAGNHDRALEHNADLAEALIPEKVHYLRDSSVILDGIKFHGIPWTPDFNPDRWAFNVTRGTERCRTIFDQIPEDCDVVVAHGPPRGYGDICPDRIDRSKLVAVGSQEFFIKLSQVKPKLVVCGHVHESHGLYIMPWGTLVANVSIFDARHLPTHPATVIDI